MRLFEIRNWIWKIFIDFQQPLSFQPGRIRKNNYFLLYHLQPEIFQLLLFLESRSETKITDVTVYNYFIFLSVLLDHYETLRFILKLLKSDLLWFSIHSWILDDSVFKIDFLPSNYLFILFSGRINVDICLFRDKISIHTYFPITELDFGSQQDELCGV